MLRVQLPWRASVMLTPRLILLFRHSSSLSHTFPRGIWWGENTSQNCWACGVNVAYVPTRGLWPSLGAVPFSEDPSTLLWAEASKPPKTELMQSLLYSRANYCHPFYKGFLLKFGLPARSAIYLNCSCIISFGINCCPLFSVSLTHLFLLCCFYGLSSHPVYAVFSYCALSHLFYSHYYRIYFSQ